MMNEECLSILQECRVTLAHAAVFIRTREKMHPVGIEQYDELLVRLQRLIKETVQPEIDEGQRQLNEGSYCFHIEEDGRYCGRAQGWAGHPEYHEFKAEQE